MYVSSLSPTALPRSRMVREPLGVMGGAPPPGEREGCSGRRWRPSSRARQAGSQSPAHLLEQVEGVTVRVGAGGLSARRLAPVRRAGGGRGGGRLAHGPGCSSYCAAPCALHLSHWQPWRELRGLRRRQTPAVLGPFLVSINSSSALRFRGTFSFPSAMGSRNSMCNHRPSFHTSSTCRQS